MTTKHNAVLHLPFKEDGTCCAHCYSHEQTKIATNARKDADQDGNNDGSPKKPRRWPVLQFSLAATAYRGAVRDLRVTVRALMFSHEV